MAEVLNANNEYQRLYGEPFPEDLNEVAREAARARKAPYQFISEKYKFADKKKERETAAAQAREDAIRKEEREKVAREYAERNGSNPMVRPGFSSTNSMVPKIKPEEFKKAGGNIPTHERNRKLLDNIHKDIEAARTA